MACEAVWAETATAFNSGEMFRRAMDSLGVAFVPIEEDAAVAAADIWRRHHARGGTRARIASDFLIGAHALTIADRLLTRDEGFYRQYFTGLMVLNPGG